MREVKIPAGWGIVSEPSRQSMRPTGTDGISYPFPTISPHTNPSVSRCGSREARATDTPAVVVDAARCEHASTLTVSEVWETTWKPKLERLGRSPATVAENQTAITAWQLFWFKTNIDEAKINGETAVGCADPKRGSVLHTEPHSPLNSHAEPAACLVSGSDLERFQTWLLGRGLEPLTANKRVGSIVAILREAAKLDASISAPNVQPLDGRTAAPAVKISHEHLNRLYAACEVANWPKSYRDPFGAKRDLEHRPALYWKWLIVWLYNYGARLQDFAAYERKKTPLRWAAITWDPESPRTDANSPFGWFDFVPAKTRRVATELVLPMNEMTYAHLMAIRPGQLNPEQPIFPMPFNKKRFRHEWKAIVAASGVTPKKLQDPRGYGYQLKHFRDTCASYHDEQCPGMASKILGHSSPGVGAKITSTHYVDSEQQMVDAVTALPQPTGFLAIKDRSQLSLPFSDP